METFKIEESFFEKLKVKSKKQFYISLLISSIIFLLNIFFNNEKSNVITNILFVIIFIGFMVYLKYTFKRIAKTQEHLYKSYKISFDTQAIKKEIFNDRGKIILNENITQIIKQKDGSFIILGKTNNDFLHIVKEIEKSDLLEEKLKSIYPISQNTKESIIEKNGNVFVVLILAILFCLFISVFLIKNIYYLYTILFLAATSWLYLKYFFKTENQLMLKMIRYINKFLVYLFCIGIFNLFLNHFT